MLVTFALYILKLSEPLVVSCDCSGCFELEFIQIQVALVGGTITVF